MKLLNLDERPQFVCAWDFNLFFNSQLETVGGNPSFKGKSVSKFYELNKTLGFWDIWQVRYKGKKGFTFRQKHFSGFIQRRLDFIFISSNLQESIVKAEVWESFISDHSSVAIKTSLSKELGRGLDLWVFNKSISQNDNFLKELKNIYIFNSLKLKRQKRFSIFSNMRFANSA